MIFNEEILKHFIKSQGLLELNQNRSSHLNILKKAKDLNFNIKTQQSSMLGDFLLPIIVYAFSDPERGLDPAKWHLLSQTNLSTAISSTGHLIVKLDTII